MSNTSKIDTSAVFEMFETIKELLIKIPQKQMGKQVEPVKVDFDTSAFDAVTAIIEIAVEEMKKPSIVENQHRHTIDIQSNWFFFSWVALCFIIGALFWLLADQRETINQYKENDLKYRYVKMQGQTNEGNLYRLERQFQYGDSIKIIRSQVEKFEELVKEQTERLERARQNSKETEKILQEVELLKRNK